VTYQYTRGGYALAGDEEAPVPSTMSTPESPQVLFANGATQVATDSPVDPLQTTYQVGSGTLTANWGGIALAGMSVAFFWWFFRSFLPGMRAAGQRESGEV